MPSSFVVSVHSCVMSSPAVSLRDRHVRDETVLVTAGDDRLGGRRGDRPAGAVQREQQPVGEDAGDEVLDVLGIVVGSGDAACGLGNPLERTPGVSRR